MHVDSNQCDDLRAVLPRQLAQYQQNKVAKARAALFEVPFDRVFLPVLQLLKSTLALFCPEDLRRKQRDLCGIVEEPLLARILCFPLGRCSKRVFQMLSQRVLHMCHELVEPIFDRATDDEGGVH